MDQYTKFDNLLTDVPKFIEYLNLQDYKGVPPRLVNSKPDLIEELKLRGYSNDFIKMTVEKSKFKSE